MPDNNLNPANQGEQSGVVNSSVQGGSTSQGAQNISPSVEPQVSLNQPSVQNVPVQADSGVNPTPQISNLNQVSGVNSEAKKSPQTAISEVKTSSKRKIPKWALVALLVVVVAAGGGLLLAGGGNQGQGNIRLQQNEDDNTAINNEERTQESAIADNSEEEQENEEVSQGETLIEEVSESEGNEENSSETENNAEVDSVESEITEERSEIVAENLAGEEMNESFENEESGAESIREIEEDVNSLVDRNRENEIVEDFEDEVEDEDGEDDEIQISPEVKIGIKNEFLTNQNSKIASSSEIVADFVLRASKLTSLTGMEMAIVYANGTSISDSTSVLSAATLECFDSTSTDKSRIYQGDITRQVLSGRNRGVVDVLSFATFSETIDPSYEVNCLLNLDLVDLILVNNPLFFKTIFNNSENWTAKTIENENSEIIFENGKEFEVFQIEKSN